MQVKICQISVGQPFFGTIFCWVKFPFFGFNSPWGNLPWTKFHLGSITLGLFFLGQISVGQWYFGTGFIWVKFRLGPFSLGLTFFFLGSTSLGFNYLGPKCFGLNFIGAMFIGLIYLGLNFLDRIPWTSLQCTMLYTTKTIFSFHGVHHENHF